MQLDKIIREFKDFPKPGIGFKDICPLLASPEAMFAITHQFDEGFKEAPFDIIAGAESRGLLFASAFAMHTAKGCLMIRKKGKLPGPTVEMEYDLEYGSGILEIQQDAIQPGQRVLVVDDLLATGGTAEGAAKLIEKVGGIVAGFAFVIELTFLHGRKLLDGYNVQSLVVYDE